MIWGKNVPNTIVTHRFHPTDSLTHTFTLYFTLFSVENYTSPGYLRQTPWTGIILNIFFPKNDKVETKALPPGTLKKMESGWIYDLRKNLKITKIGLHYFGTWCFFSLFFFNFIKSVVTYAEDQLQNTLNSYMKGFDISLQILWLQKVDDIVGDVQIK